MRLLLPINTEATLESSRTPHVKELTRWTAINKWGVVTRVTGRNPWWSSVDWRGCQRSSFTREWSSDQPGNVRARGAPAPPLEEAQGDENESSLPSSVLQGCALHSKEPSLKEDRMWGWLFSAQSEDVCKSAYRGTRVPEDLTKNVGGVRGGISTGERNHAAIWR